MKFIVMLFIFFKKREFVFNVCIVVNIIFCLCERVEGLCFLFFGYIMWCIYENVLGLLIV